MHRSDKKMRIVFLDHFFFKPLAKLGFPLVAVLSAPSPVRLAHFPIAVHHCVALTVHVAASKLVAKIEVYFLECLRGCFFKERILSEGRQLGGG